MTPSNLEILACEETPLGLLCLRRRTPLHDPTITVTEITLNHEFLMSSYYTASERALATIALEMHGGHDLDILVGGLGLGYTVFEALRNDRVKHATVVEYLPEVISWLRQGFIPLSKALHEEKRLNIIQDDVYGRLAKAPEAKYDIIMIDVDHSPDERLDTQCGRFYSQEGLMLARQHLNTNGILAVWSYAQDSPFTAALRDVFREVRMEPISFDHKFLNNKTHTDWLFFAR